MNYLALLESGIENWNQWRKDHPGEICDLSGQDLQEGYFVKGNFSRVNFEGAQLQRACLIGANLQGANLSNADLSGAYMGEADLQGANLTNAQLTETNLNRANFREAILDGVDIVEANIYKAEFSEGVIDKKMTLYTRAERDAGIATQAIKNRENNGLASTAPHISDSDSRGSDNPSPNSLDPDSLASKGSTPETTASDNVIALADKHTAGEVIPSLTREVNKHNSPEEVASASVLKFPTEVPERAIRIQPQTHNRPSALDDNGRAGETSATQQQPGKLLSANWLPAIAVVSSLVGLGLLILGNNLLFSGQGNRAPKQQQQPSSYSEQTDIQQTAQSTQSPAMPSTGSPLVAEASTTSIQWDSLEQVQTLDNKSPVLAIAAYQASENGTQDTNLNNASNSNAPIVISGDEDGNLTLWNQRTGESLRTLPGHRAAIRSLAISPSNQWLVSGGDDGIKTWNLNTGELAYNLPANNNPTWTVAIGPSERVFISADYNGNITVWQLDNGAPLYRMNTGSVVWDLAIAPDGQSFVSGGDDNSITQWDIANGEKLRTFDGHSGTVGSVAISPDGQTLVSGSWDRTIKLWQLATGKIKNTLTGHETKVESIAISANGKLLASVSADSQLMQWDMVQRQRIDTVTPPTERIVAIDFAADTQTPAGEYTLVSSGKDQTIEVWQPTTKVQ